jgi:hypothetical protein
MKFLKTAVLVLVTVIVLLYAADYLAVRIPVPKSRPALGTVTVRPYYDVTLKDGKSEFYVLDPQEQTCVNSVLPHMGYTPCWYLRKHTHPRTAM